MKVATFLMESAPSKQKYFRVLYRKPDNKSVYKEQVFDSKAQAEDFVEGAQNAGYAWVIEYIVEISREDNPAPPPPDIWDNKSTQKFAPGDLPSRSLFKKRF